MKPTPLLAVFAVLLDGAPLSAEEIDIRQHDSIIAVVTHKAGFAAAKAHNHLIAATGYQATLVFDEEAPLATRFELSFAAEDLTVDPWKLQQAWYPRLEKLGVLDQAYTEVAEKDRRKIRKSMLGSEQLDAAEHPRISARLAGVAESASTHGGVSFPYVATLVLEVHGQSVEQPAAARYESAAGELTIEAVATFRFTDFRIEPYSAFFGAVKNQDEFHVYVNLKGSRPAE